MIPAKARKGNWQVSRRVSNLQEVRPVIEPKGRTVNWYFPFEHCFFSQSICSISISVYLFVLTFLNCIFSIITVIQQCDSIMAVPLLSYNRCSICSPHPVDWCKALPQSRPSPRAAPPHRPARSPRCPAVVPPRDQLFTGVR